MRKALRPYMTAGVAVVGASAIAIAPVIATPPDVRIINPAVQQSAGPLESYVENVREALENLEALLGSTLALPAPTGWTLGLALESLLRDPGGVAVFVDEFEALGPLAGASVPVLLDRATEAVEESIGQAVAGNIDLAVVGLIRTYVTLAPVVAAVVSAPLKLLGPELGESASVVLAKSLNAAVGPVLSGVGKTGVALQNIVNALNNSRPGSGALLSALIAAPGTVADGVLNGYAIEPGTTALPGLLTPGDPFDPTKPNPGPVSLVAGLARGFGAESGPVHFRSPEPERVVTFELNAGEATLAPQTGSATKGTGDPDASTNATVMADDGVTGLSGGVKQRQGPSGDGAASRAFGGDGLATLRQGIHDGIRDVRQGIRDAVKTVTGRGDAGAAAGEAAPIGEPHA